jgi:hypothetical protein
MPTVAPQQQKITLAEMRASGVRGLLVSSPRFVYFNDCQRRG